MALNHWLERYARANGMVYLDYFSAMVDEHGRCGARRPRPPPERSRLRGDGAARREGHRASAGWGRSRAPRAAPAMTPRRCTRWGDEAQVFLGVTLSAGRWGAVVAVFVAQTNGVHRNQALRNRRHDNDVRDC